MEQLIWTPTHRHHPEKINKFLLVPSNPKLSVAIAPIQPEYFSHFEISMQGTNKPTKRYHRIDILYWAICLCLSKLDMLVSNVSCRMHVRHIPSRCHVELHILKCTSNVYLDEGPCATLTSAHAVCNWKWHKHYSTRTWRICL